MSLNVGHLVGYLELDDKKFNRSAERADRKMTALQLHLKALAATNPKIQVDVETRKLDELKAKMVDLKAQAAKGVDVRVEVAQALIAIDRVESKLRMLHNREVRIDVDNRTALAKLGAVGSKINGLWASVLGLGPMLVPLAAAGAGGLLAIGSASVSAAAGVGVLAAAFHGLGKATSALSTYRQAVDQAGPKAQIQREQLALGVKSAQASAANSAAAVNSAKKAYAKHPTASNAARVQAAQRASALAPSKLQIALQKQAMGPQALASAKSTLDKSEYGKQTKAGQNFAAFTLDSLKPASSRLHASAQSAVLPGVERGLKSIIPLVPLFDRLITHVGHALGQMAARAGKALNDPFWRHFFQWVSQTAGPTLLVMGHTFGQVFEGIARVLQRFGPQGQSVVHWVDMLATKFNAWSQGGSGSSFQRFMDYIAQAGPAVVGVLKPLGIIIGQLIAGMSQSGMGELHTFGLLLDGIAHLPTGAIQTIGVVLPGIILALKGMELANAIANITGLSSAFGGLARNAEGAAATGALGGKGNRAGLGVALGVGGIADAAHRKGKTGYAEAIGSGALAGGLAASVIPGVGTLSGAAVGGAIGGLVHLVTQLNATKTATKRGAGAWQDYAVTLDGVSAHATQATRALAYQRLEASGMLDATRKLGLTDREAVQAVMGNVAARKKLGAALADEQATHRAGLSDRVIQNIYGETSAVGKSRLAQLKMNLAIAHGRVETQKAQAALDAFAKTDGTAKVGLTGAEKTIRQLHTMNSLINGLTGSPTGPGGGIKNHVTGGIAALVTPGHHRALGGPVAAGHLYEINERGPELFAPRVSGEIISNSNVRAMMSGGGGGIDYDRLAHALSAVRPLYGDVHISGDPTTFRREMAQDARRSSLDGVRRGMR